MTKRMGHIQESQMGVPGVFQRTNKTRRNFEPRRFEKAKSQTSVDNSNPSGAGGTILQIIYLCVGSANMIRLSAFACCLLATPAVSFAPAQSATIGIGIGSRAQSSPPTTTQLASSYLDSLGGGGASSAPAASAGAPSWDAAAPAAPVASSNAPADAAGPFAHAPLDYFALPNLSGKGPRATADWGTPADATRKLSDDGMLRSGAWYCTEGGWPSPNPKAHTEIFYVLDGHGMLGDADGAKHYFGPGDTVIIPKGHTGRWDVHSPIHKIWAVNAHENIAETSHPVRVRVEPYSGCAPHCLDVGVDALYGSSSIAPGGAAAATVSSRDFYNVGPTRVGYWSAQPGSVAVGSSGRATQPRTFFYVMEGVLFVTDAATGTSQRCVAGDTVQLPGGWVGTIDVVEPVRKMYTLAE